MMSCGINGIVIKKVKGERFIRSEEKPEYVIKKVNVCPGWVA